MCTRKIKTLSQVGDNTDIVSARTRDISTSELVICSFTSSKVGAIQTKMMSYYGRTEVSRKGTKLPLIHISDFFSKKGPGGSSATGLFMELGTYDQPRNALASLSYNISRPMFDSNWQHHEVQSVLVELQCEHILHRPAGGNWFLLCRLRRVGRTCIDTSCREN